MERLKQAVKSTPHIVYGVGIDDSTAVEWSGKGTIRVVGPGRVLIVKKTNDGDVTEEAWLRNGERFDLEDLDSSFASAEIP